MLQYFFKNLLEVVTAAILIFMNSLSISGILYFGTYIRDNFVSCLMIITASQAFNLFVIKLSITQM